MQEELFLECIEQAKKAFKKNEVPIGALIYNKKTKKKYSAYNKKNKKNNPLLHAEIIVINKMAKKYKKWRLDECDLYVTIEPCDMCKSIIKETRINKVYYGYQSSYHKNNQKEINKYINLEKKESIELMKSFFELRRKK